ncbi:hypothetical protein [uncultured Ferrimonas sp.]|uniref:hypothetical protein n=1 Tax=uncultured Ferrimonas sp. TaxID=432640 RepID=UPI00260A6823|nr:hypothetical protein [uncultured Ferrimonas sp.]
MKMNQLFKLSALTSAILLGACGGDINIDTGSEATPAPTTPTTPTNPTDPIAAKYGSFAQKSSSIAMVDGKQVWTLSGALLAAAASSATSGNLPAITLGNDVVWELNGAVVIGGDNQDSLTLNIEAGSKILGNSDAYLVISRGSQINALGSAEAPIVFTSVESGLGLGTDRGQWGGLVLLGNAPVNTCADMVNCDASFEVGNHQYGGDNEQDNSGTLQYVRVEFGGFKINDTQELNGISFAGVGAGTTVNHLQVHKNDDDGIEFWGGNVSVQQVVLTDNFDDSLDWTNGWQGSAQHVYIRTEDNAANRGIEADSSKSDPLGLPMSKPTLANLTLQLGGGENAAGDDAEGILFRVATGATLYNTLVKGGLETGECLEINGTDTVANAQGGELVMSHSLIDCVEPFKDPKDSDGNSLFDVAAWFQGQTSNIVAAADLSGYQPNSSSLALTGGKADLANTDPRLVDANYIGAFDGSNDWTQGWTTAIHSQTPAPEVLQPLSSCPAGTVNDAADAALIDGADLACTLSGNINTNVTLLAGTNVVYKLDGAVVIGGDNTNSATLGIEAGTTVYGNDGGYLVISRGSKIMAQGSATQPINFTSFQDVSGQAGDRGQWGGLVILGNGLVNTCASADNCDVAFEVGNHQYGGNNNSDSSGTLSHVVVKYGGFKINDTQELNGISFGAVGSGTQVDHIQVHMNDDDGVEFWGGAVNLKYLYLTDNFDDSLDWTNGWTGKAQHIFITQQDNHANRGIEGDSSKSDPLGTPTSKPTLSNITILPAGGTHAGGDDAEGIILRVATSATISNLIVQGGTTGAVTGECLEFDGSDTIANATSADLSINHSIIDCSEPFKNDADVPAFDLQTWFLAQTGNVAGAVALTNGIPSSDSIALGNGKDMSADSFFDATDYIGAFNGSDDWTSGWTHPAN